MSDAIIPVNSETLIAELDAIETDMLAQAAEIERRETAIADLVAKAGKLVKLMDEAETHHGGLIGGVTLRAKNELRLELSKWKS